jgi:hypothetical protein
MVCRACRHPLGMSTDHRKGLDNLPSLAGSKVLRTARGRWECDGCSTTCPAIFSRSTDPAPEPEPNPPGPSSSVEVVSEELPDGPEGEGPERLYSGAGNAAGVFGNDESGRAAYGLKVEDRRSTGAGEEGEAE